MRSHPSSASCQNTRTRPTRTTASPRATARNSTGGVGTDYPWPLGRPTRQRGSVFWVQSLIFQGDVQQLRLAIRVTMPSGAPRLVSLSCKDSQTTNWARILGRPCASSSWHRFCGRDSGAGAFTQHVRRVRQKGASFSMVQPIRLHGIDGRGGGRQIQELRILTC